MEYIEAKTGRQTFYIEKEKVAAILENPVIHRVPGADDNIAGISLQDGRLAVYFYLDEKSEGPCGVLMDTGKKILYGFTAESVGIGDIDPGLLMAVMTGVWVIKSD